MDKRTSVVVRLFIISLSYFPIGTIAQSIYLYHKNFWLIVTYQPRYALFIILYLFLFVATFIVLIIGLLKFKKWAYNLSIIIMYFTTIGGIYTLARESNLASLTYITAIIVLCYFITLIYFFTRPNIKGQFR